MDPGAFDQHVKMELAIVKNQLHLEDLFWELATDCGQPAVIICDRGVMDNKAYVDKQVWDAILEETGWNTV